MIQLGVSEARGGVRVSERPGAGGCGPLSRLVWRVGPGKEGAEPALCSGQPGTRGWCPVLPVSALLGGLGCPHGHGRNPRGAGTAREPLSRGQFHLSPRLLIRPSKMHPWVLLRT